MTKKQKLVSLCFAMSLFLLGNAQGYAYEQEAAAISVGRHTVSVSQAQKEVDDQIAAYQNTYIGMTFSQEDYVYIRDQTMNSLVTFCIMDNVVEDMELTAFTQEESEALMMQAETTYQQTLDYFRQDYASMDMNLIDDETAGKMAADYLEREGCTVDAFYQTAIRYAQYDRLYDKVTCDVVLTPEEIEDYYTKNYVEPDQIRAEHGIAEYEYYVAASVMGDFYMPDGYRAISDILLPIPQEIQAKLDVCKEKMLSLQDTLEDYLAQEETEEVILARSQLQAEMENLTEEHDHLLDEALTVLQPTIDQIYERLQNGEDFEALRQDVGKSDSLNQGEDEYMIHKESVLYDTELRDAAMALKAVGDVSDPVLSESGVHIMKYMSDIPSGPVAPSDQTALADEAVGVKKAEVFEAAIEQWRENYPPEIHGEYIVLP